MKGYDRNKLLFHFLQSCGRKFYICLSTDLPIDPHIALSSFAAQVPRLNFEPTPEFPALQYFGHVEEGGQAESKGVKAGDFILEVSPSESIFFRFKNSVKTGRVPFSPCLQVYRHLQTCPLFRGSDCMRYRGYMYRA